MLLFEHEFIIYLNTITKSLIISNICELKKNDQSSDRSPVSHIITDFNRFHGTTDYAEEIESIPSLFSRRRPAESLFPSNSFVSVGHHVYHIKTKTTAVNNHIIKSYWLLFYNPFHSSLGVFFFRFFLDVVRQSRANPGAEAAGSFSVAAAFSCYAVSLIILNNM